MAYSQTGFIGILLFYLPAGAELYSAIGIGNNLYGLLGEVGVYALVDYWFIAIGDAGYIVVIP